MEETELARAPKATRLEVVTGVCAGEGLAGCWALRWEPDASVLADEYVESPLPAATSVGPELPLYCQGGGGPGSPGEKGPTVKVVTFPVHTAGPRSGLTPPSMHPPQAS